LKEIKKNFDRKLKLRKFSFLCSCKLSLKYALNNVTIKFNFCLAKQFQMPMGVIIVSFTGCTTLRESESSLMDSTSMIHLWVEIRFDNQVAKNCKEREIERERERERQIDS